MLNFICSFYLWYATMFIDFNTIEDLAKWSYSNPQKISYWIQHHIQYKSDESVKDCWQSTNIVFKNRKCDCEEFATFFYTILDLWDVEWEREILCVYKIEQDYDNSWGHAVCVYKKNNKWYIASNGHITKTKTNCLLELPKMIKSDFNCWRIATKEGETKYYGFKDKEGNVFIEFDSDFENYVKREYIK